VCPARFDRLAVSRLAAGATTVSWQPAPDYRGPGLATLEVSADGPAGPFAPASAAVPTLSHVLVDPTPRPAPDRVWYRVRLADAGPGVPVPAGGALGRQDWLVARRVALEATRKLSRGGAAPGYLLKRRWAGEACPTCGDPLTGQPTRPDCPTCLGTGVRCGYHPPVGCVWLALAGGRLAPTPAPDGAADPRPFAGEGVLAPLCEPGDVWCHRLTDDRFQVTAVDPTVRVGGVAVLARLALAPLAPTSPVYRVPPPPDRPAAHPGLWLLGQSPLGA
jgi:hypothetical protein